MPPVSASRTAAPSPPRKPLNLRALLIPAGVLAGLLIVGLVGFFVIRTLSNNGCESFSTARSTVTLDGLTIGVRPDALNGNFGVKLNKIPLNEFSAGSSNADAKAAAAALPAALKPVSAFYNISTCNTAPKSATLRLNLPADVTPSDTLDLYAWDPTARAWRWVGGGVEDLTKSVVAQVSSVPPSLADFDPAAFHAYAQARLPHYAVPVFVRVTTASEITTTFKLRKIDLQREGFDAWWPSEKLAVHGYTEALRHYRFYTARMRDLGIQPAGFPGPASPPSPS